MSVPSNPHQDAASSSGLGSWNLTERSWSHRKDPFFNRNDSEESDSPPIMNLDEIMAILGDASRFAKDQPWICLQTLIAPIE